VYKERVDTSYGAGVGLTAGITKRRWINESQSTQVTEVKCKCGSNTHKQTNHRDYPLRRKRLMLFYVRYHHKVKLLSHSQANANFLRILLR